MVSPEFAGRLPLEKVLVAASGPIQTGKKNNEKSRNKGSFMKKLALLLFATLTLPTYSWAASITVTNPVGGHEYCMYTPQTITWTKSGAMGDQASIFVMHPNGQSVIRTLAIHGANNGHFSWDGGVSHPGTYIIKISVSPTAQYPTPVSGQSGVFTIKNCDQPDLQVGVIKVTPQNPGEGHTVTYKANVMNYGNAPATNPVVVLRVRRPGGLPDKIYRQEMHVTLQKYQGVTFVQRFPVPKAGNYKTTFAVDPANMIAELDDHNNSKDWTFGVLGLPDLMVCIDNGKRPPVGGKRDIHAMVRNIGSASTSGMGHITLRFSVEKKGTRTYSIPPLAPGQSHTVNRRYSWSLSGTKHLSARVSYDKSETDRRNNEVSGSYFVRLPHHDTYSAAPHVKCSTGENFNSWQQVEQRY